MQYITSGACPIKVFTDTRHIITLNFRQNILRREAGSSTLKVRRTTRLKKIETMYSQQLDIYHLQPTQLFVQIII
jgi:hypothetical protein